MADRRNPKATAALIERVTRTGPSSDPEYRAKSKTIETFVTNNVEDLLRARRLAAAIATGQAAPPGLTLEGTSRAYVPIGGADRLAGLD
jgi:hypothetical protein